MNKTLIQIFLFSNCIRACNHEVFREFPEKKCFRNASGYVLESALQDPSYQFSHKETKSQKDFCAAMESIRHAWNEATSEFKNLERMLQQAYNETKTENPSINLNYLLTHIVEKFDSDKVIELIQLCLLLQDHGISHKDFPAQTLISNPRIETVLSTLLNISNSDQKQFRFARYLINRIKYQCIFTNCRARLETLIKEGVSKYRFNLFQSTLNSCIQIISPISAFKNYFSIELVKDNFFPDMIRGLEDMQKQSITLDINTPSIIQELKRHQTQGAMVTAIINCPHRSDRNIILYLNQCLDKLVKWQPEIPKSPMKRAYEQVENAVENTRDAKRPKPELVRQQEYQTDLHLRDFVDDFNTNIQEVEIALEKISAGTSEQSQGFEKLFLDYLETFVSRKEIKDSDIQTVNHLLKLYRLCMQTTLNNEVPVRILGNVFEKACKIEVFYRNTDIIHTITRLSRILTYPLIELPQDLYEQLHLQIQNLIFVPATTDEYEKK